MRYTMHWAPSPLSLLTFHSLRPSRPCSCQTPPLTFPPLLLSTTGCRHLLQPREQPPSILLTSLLRPLILPRLHFHTCRREKCLFAIRHGQFFSYLFTFRILPSNPFLTLISCCTPFCTPFFTPSLSTIQIWRSTLTFLTISPPRTPFLPHSTVSTSSILPAALKHKPSPPPSFSHPAIFPTRCFAFCSRGGWDFGRGRILRSRTEGEVVELERGG